MIKTILTIAMILALAYGILWFSHDFAMRRADLQCRIDYGIKGCKE